MARASTALQLSAALLSGLLTLAGCENDSKTALDDPTGGVGGDGGAGGAVGGGGGAVEQSATFCASETRFDYDPFAKTSSQVAFPDDFFTVEGDTATGRVVSLTDDNAPWLEAIPGNYREVYEELNGLDGFGTSAAPFIRLSGPVGFSPGEEVDGLMLLDLGGPTAVEVPYTIELADNGSTILLWPDVPMRPATRHAVVMTTAAETADYDCVTPGDALKALLLGEADHPLAARYTELLEKTALKPQDVSAAVTFTTQSISDMSVAVAENIKSRDHLWTGQARCRTDRGNKRCDRKFSAWDYRDDTGLITKAEPFTPYELTAAVWLPATGEGPWPTIIMGHGLGSSREQAGILGAFADDYGVAIVSIDAVEHGQHPARKSQDATISLTNFFGITVARQIIRPSQMRDNFRQSTYDKLQLIKTLVADPDVDGDGEADLDMERLGYFGVSLGGILGSEPLALSDRFQIGVLSMPGGRMVPSIRDSETFAPLIQLLIPRQASEGDEARLFPVIQAVADAGDGVNYAPHILNDRLQGPDGQIPHTLFMVAVGDKVVPNSASNVLAQAMDIPHMAPVKVSLPLLGVVEGDMVTANLPDGITAGMFQYEKITPEGSSGLQIVEHETLPTSDEALDQLGHFVRTWVNDGTPEIINPWR